MKKLLILVSAVTLFGALSGCTRGTKNGSAPTTPSISNSDCNPDGSGCGNSGQDYNSDK